MSDGITEARRGTYFSGNNVKVWYNKEIQNDVIDLVYEQTLDEIPIEYIEKYIRRKKLKNISEKEKNK